MRLMILLLALIMPWYAQAEIYKWVDEHGVVNYSDTPHTGSATVDLPDIQTFPSQSSSNASPATDNSGNQANAQATNVSQAEPFNGYQSITITQPENEGTVRDNQGMVNITAALSPDLQPGHALKAILDGTPVGKAVQGTSLNITGVERGAHKLQVEVLGNDGNVIKASPSITFYMHQTSIVSPH